MSIQERINQKIKQGTVTNKYGIEQIEVNISVSESLEFASYLSGVAIEKGRTSGTVDQGSLVVISDWYHIGKGDIEIVSLSGKTIGDRRKYYQMIYTKVNQ